MQINKKSITPDETIEVKVDVTNTGKVLGKEIVQLYVHDVQSTFARPEKELKAFEKIELKPNETKTVTFKLDREAFWYFDTIKNAWAVDPGEFEILVGASSRDIRLSGTVSLQPEKRATRLHAGLTVKALFDDPDGHVVLSKYLGGFLLMADMSMAGDMTLEQIAHHHPGFVPQEMIQKIEKELANFK